MIQAWLSTTCAATTPCALGLPKPEQSTFRWSFSVNLYFGAQKASRRDEALTQINEFLKTAVLLEPDETTALHYGQVKAELMLLGKPIPENDVWIAATALQYKLPIATRDAHFAHVPNSRVLTW